VAERAVTHNTAKYTDMTSHLVFHHITAETQGPLNESACDLLTKQCRQMHCHVLCHRPSCFNEFQLSCSSLILSCCMTVFLCWGPASLMVIPDQFCCLIFETPGTVFWV